MPSHKELLRSLRGTGYWPNREERTAIMGRHSKTKGSGFERYICKSLSGWMSRGTRDDLFWRSAMSGGRASVRFRQGFRAAQQSGDISAIDPAGDRLTSKYLIECKCYRDLRLHSLLYPSTDKTPKDSIAYFWEVCCADAQRHGKRPMLIGRQGPANHGEFVLLDNEGADGIMGHLSILAGISRAAAIFPHHNAYLFHFEEIITLGKRP